MAKRTWTTETMVSEDFSGAYGVVHGLDKVGCEAKACESKSAVPLYPLYHPKSRAEHLASLVAETAAGGEADEEGPAS